METSTVEQPAADAVTTTMRDRADITDLIYRLAACLDEHRFDDLMTLFTEDVTATTPGGTAVGREALVAQATRNHADYQGLQHLVTGPLVEVHGATATARANLVGIFCSDKGIPERVIGGVYRFTAVNSMDRWRFSSLTVTPTWMFPAVFLPAREEE